MPRTASYLLDPADGVVRVRFSENVTLADALEMLRAVAADPALPAAPDMLVDLRNAPPLPDSAHLRSIVGTLERLAPALRFGACALVASSDPHYGMSRIFAVYAERTFEAVQTFRELPDAEAWLRARRAAGERARP